MQKKEKMLWIFLTISSIVLLIIAIPILVSAEDIRANRNCPCRITTDSRRNNLVQLVDKRGVSIKIYPAATNRKNVAFFQEGDEFWVKQSSGWVTVYDINTGAPLRSYSANPRNSNWVR